jgi:hypothetical protein
MRSFQCQLPLLACPITFGVANYLSSQKHETQSVYEVRPRNDKRGVDLISDALHGDIEAPRLMVDENVTFCGDAKIGMGKSLPA